MALIYASAVNRRMNALQKKHSVDLIPTQHSPQHQEMLIAHCKQRSNEERLTSGGGSGQQREGSLENDRKRSAPHPVNRVNGILGGGGNSQSANSSPISNSKPSAAVAAIQHSKKSNSDHPKACRKLTVVDGQLFRPIDGLVAAAKPRRKISTPVMAQSVMGELKMGGEGGRRGQHKKHGSKTNSPDSFCSFDDEQQQQALKGPKGGGGNGGGGGIFASFGRVVRRRSVSADAEMFRMRGGTNSSMDSSQGEGGSPGARKSSAFQKMKERLNKWKLSG